MRSDGLCFLVFGCFFFSGRKIVSPVLSRSITSMSLVHGVIRISYRTWNQFKIAQAIHTDTGLVATNNQSETDQRARGNVSLLAWSQQVVLCLVFPAMHSWPPEAFSPQGEISTAESNESWSLWTLFPRGCLDTLGLRHSLSGCPLGSQPCSRTGESQQGSPQRPSAWSH